MELNQERSYGLDFLKLIFSFVVFFSHTVTFSDETTWLDPVQYNRIGFFSVHFFFVVSGMLMVRHLVSAPCDDTISDGKASLEYVIGKIKKLLVPYFTALVLSYIVRFIADGSVKTSLKNMLLAFPEMMFVQESGLSIFNFNPPAWYISAMIIVMLPLYYILRKTRKSEAGLCVFAPIAGILLYGYLFRKGDDPMSQIHNFTLIRAVCGICMGTISWHLSVALYKYREKQSARLAATIAELLIYALCLCCLFIPQFNNNNTLYSVYLLLPIGIAVSFSEISYFSEFFKAKFFRYLGNISLTIYLVHHISIPLVKKWFPESGYIESVTYMAAITVVLCLVDCVAVHAIKSCSKKHRSL